MAPAAILSISSDRSLAQISTFCGERLASVSARTIAMLYGSWPEEQPADQIRIVVPGDSLSQAATRSAMNVKWAGSRKKAVWLTVRQVDQELRAPTRRVDLEHLLVELGKALEVS